MQSVTITLLVFVAMYQLSSRMDIRPLTSASIIALTPLLYTLIVRIIFKTSLMNLVQPHDILTLILQVGVAYAIFYKLDHDDSPVTWVTWGVAGWILVSIVIPVLVFSWLPF